MVRLAEETRRQPSQVSRALAALEAETAPFNFASVDLRVALADAVSALPESSDDEDGLVAAADAALYEAKRAGKNRAIRAHGARAAGT